MSQWGYEKDEDEDEYEEGFEEKWGSKRMSSMRSIGSI